MPTLSLYQREAYQTNRCRHSLLGSPSHKLRFSSVSITFFLRTCRVVTGTRFPPTISSSIKLRLQNQPRWSKQVRRPKLLHPTSLPSPVNSSSYGWREGEGPLKLLRRCSTPSGALGRPQSSRREHLDGPFTRLDAPPSLCVQAYQHLHRRRIGRRVVPESPPPPQPLATNLFLTRPAC